MSVLVPQHLCGLRVLIAEDSPVHRRLSQQWLEMAGCQIEAVGDGQAAVEAFARRTFDLVLLDCRMPGMDGYTAAEAIRRHEAEQGTAQPAVIVALTAFASDADREKCLQVGMNDYYIKPMRPDVVQRLLSSSLRGAA